MKVCALEMPKMLLFMEHGGMNEEKSAAFGVGLVYVDAWE